MIAYRQVVIVSLLVVMASACASTGAGGGSSSSTTGTLRGELVLVGGALPTGAAQPTPRPWSGWVSIAQGAKLVVSKMHVDGNFTQNLPAGTYTLSAYTLSGGCESTSFTIVPRQDTTAETECIVP